MTPAIARSATAPADAGHRPSRSSPASSCPSTQPPRPARPDAPRRRSGRVPRPSNRQPVVASSATTKPASLNGARNFRTPARSAGTIVARDTSPVIVSIHSAEICARCWSRPITTDTRSPPRCSERRRAQEHRPPTGQPIAYREPRSVPPLRIGRPRGRYPRAPTTPFDAEYRPPSRPMHTPTGTSHLWPYRRPPSGDCLGDGRMAG